MGQGENGTHAGIKEWKEDHFRAEVHTSRTKTAAAAYYAKQAAWRLLTNALKHALFIYI
jgi:hypothetical protein